jgi:hypothetical protein
MTTFFGAHVCGTECGGEKGCLEARREKGRLKRVQAAKLFCATCPVRQDCLDYAMDNVEEFGIWGGLTERERRNLRNEK